MAPAFMATIGLFWASQRRRRAVHTVTEPEQLKGSVQRYLPHEARMSPLPMFIGNSRAQRER